jgi:hypothetical protein
MYNTPCAAAIASRPSFYCRVFTGQGPLQSRLWQAGPDGGPTVHHKSAIRTIGNNGFGSQEILRGRNAKPSNVLARSRIQRPRRCRRSPPLQHERPRCRPASAMTRLRRPSRLTPRTLPSSAWPRARAPLSGELHSNRLPPSPCLLPPSSDSSIVDALGGLVWHQSNCAPTCTRAFAMAQRSS